MAVYYRLDSHLPTKFGLQWVDHQDRLVLIVIQAMLAERARDYGSLQVMSQFQLDG